MIQFMRPTGRVEYLTKCVELQASMKWPHIWDISSNLRKKEQNQMSGTLLGQNYVRHTSHVYIAAYAN